MKVKSDIATEKVSLEQKIDTLTSDLKKANNNINQLKQENDSKTDKLKNVEEANKELLQTLKNYKENNTTLVQVELDKFKNESLNEKRSKNQLLNLWNSNPTCKLKSPKTQKTRVQAQK